MSMQNWIPEVWAGDYLRNLHKAHVYGNGNVINRDYEGEISGFGDTVRINSVGAVTISDYTRNTAISAPQVLESAQQILSISQQKMFNFLIDDLDKAQTKPKVMEAAMYEAAYGISDTSDSYIAGLLAGNVASANTLGTSGAPKTDLATDKVPYNYLVDMAKLLDQSNTPRSGRFAIIPPWYYAYIRKDSQFLHSTGAADTLLRTGQVDGPINDDFYVGNVAGFSTWMSNNVPSVNGLTSFQIVAGHRSAWSFAEQLTEIESYKHPSYFGDCVRGLHVYGGKVTRPASLALLYANPT